MKDAEYVPWRVLQTRQRNGQQEALVQWVGYPISRSAWEPASEPAIARLLGRRFKRGTFVQIAAFPMELLVWHWNVMYVLL